jgi:hypothetical protein
VHGHYDETTSGSDRSVEPTCMDELQELLNADRVIIDLTGPAFPFLEPVDAAHVLMVAAVLMPPHLQVRTMNLGINLLHTEDWNGGLGMALRHGDPLAEILWAPAVELLGRLAAEPLDEDDEADGLSATG